MTDDPLSATLAALRLDARLNLRAERERIALDHRCLAMVRAAMGYRTALPEPERKRLSAEAGRAVARHAAGEALGAVAGRRDALLADLLSAVALARPPIVALERETRRATERHAAGLPGIAWCDGVAGFSRYGYGLIVATLGDPRGFPGPCSVRNFMGNAPKDSYPASDGGGRMRPVRNLALLYYKIGDPLWKHENAYRRIMRARLALEAERRPEFLRAPDGERIVYSLHCHRRAQRYALSRLLTDLWRAWHGQEPRLDASARVHDEIAAQPST